MTTQIRNPSIRAPELQALVLNAIPSLGDELRQGNPNDPHRVMRTLFDYATAAIRGGDMPAVIRCFRLTKHLASLGEECDIFVTSAIWASFIHRFRSNDPVALKVFEGIDPRIRETLYSPFTFPHTWLREKEIQLPGADQWRAWLTVNRQVKAEARLVQQMTCRGHFAVVQLQLEPMLEDRSILFRNCLDNSDDAPLVYLEAVIEGVTQALVKRSGGERGMSYLRIDLLGLRHHFVDSRKDDFVTTAGEAVERCIAEAGLVDI
jgi:hypothetical protein